MQTSEDAVTSGGELAHDDVTGLLAAKREPVRIHRLKDVAVTDLGLVDVNVVLTHRQDEAEVAHDRRDDGVGGQAMVLLQSQGEDGDDVVAVDDVAIVVDGQAAVGIAVEGQAHIGPDLDNLGLQLLRVSGTAALVDIEAVRLVVDRDDLRTLGLEGGRGGVVGGTVGGVEDDLQTLEGVLLSQGTHQVVDVGVDGLRGVTDASDLVADGSGPRLPHALLDGVLEIVGELHTAAGEELDAVVRHRVVRGRQHDAEVGAVLVDEVGRGRGRDDAHAQDVDSCTCQTSAHCCLEELARGARVTCHQRGGLAVPESTSLAQDVGSRNREVEGQFGGEVLVGHTAHSVSSKKSCHEMPLYPPLTPSERNTR